MRKHFLIFRLVLANVRCLDGDTERRFYIHRDASATNGFKPFAGEEAKWKLLEIPDVLICETVASRVWACFRKRPFEWKRKIEDNLNVFKKRLRKCEAHINKNYEVDGL